MTDDNSVTYFHGCKRPLTVIDYYCEHLTGCMTAREGETTLFRASFSGVGVITAFSGCLIELDGFAGATLGTDNFIRVNKPS
jgi:hypothetical protein